MWPDNQQLSSQETPFFGREKESKILLDHLHAFDPQHTNLLWIEGPAGIGKTTLIRNVLSKYQRDKCFFLYGKHNDTSDKVPYEALKQILRDWTEQIMTLSEEELSILRENAISALQGNIKVITAVFPELNLFFGKKAVLSSAPALATEPQQMQTKFYYFFIKFLRSIVRSGYGLVVFADDLQWIDNASWRLLNEVLSKNQVSDVTIVTASRPSEIGPSELLKKYASRMALHSLMPLDTEHVSSFIPSRWNLKKEERNAFLQYLWLESEGNPFRAGEIIRIIERENLLEPASDFDSLRWEKLPTFGNDKSTVNLLIEEFNQLSADKKTILGTASCINYHFEAQLLQTITQLSDAVLQQELPQLCQENFLVKKGNNYFFVHDHVFAAAQSLTTSEEKKNIHRSIGKLIFDGIETYEDDAFIRGLNHLNRSIDGEQLATGVLQSFILLNIHGARLALQKSAGETALDYFTFAQQLFETFGENAFIIEDKKLADAFQKDSLAREEIQYMIKYGFAQTLFLLQNFEKAYHYSNEILDLNISRHQRLLATFFKVRICSALVYRKDSKPILIDGISALENSLREYGIVIPAPEEQITREIEEMTRKLQATVSAQSQRTNFDLRLSDDQEYHDLVRLIVNSTTFVYYMNVKKFCFLLLKNLLMAFEKGVTPITPTSFAASFSLAVFNKELQPLAFELGKLSLKMIKEEPFRRCSHIVYYIATLNFYAWLFSYKKCIKTLQKAIRLAQEAGDHHYVNFCAVNIRLLSTYAGRNLKKHLVRTQEHERQNLHIFFISSSENDMIHYLTGMKPGFAEGNFVFAEALLDESEYNMSSRYHLNLAREKLYFFSGHFEEAIAAGNVCENLALVYCGFQIELEHQFYYCLSLLQHAFAHPETLADALEKVMPKLNEFERLSAFGSGNYLHKFLLISAEIEKCKGLFEKATEYYDLAIQEAKEQKFLHVAAISAELAGEYYLSKNRRRFAELYLKESVRYYRKWGADAKAELLLKKHEFLQEQVQPSHPSESLESERRAFRSVYSAATAHQRKLDELGDYLLGQLAILSEAKTAALLVSLRQKWRVVSVKGAKTPIPPGAELPETKGKLPVTVFNYAIHTAESVSGHSQMRNVLFENDEYLQAAQPANFHCFPVIYQGEMTGLIYLENVQGNFDAKSSLFSFTLEHSSIALANAIYFENNKLLYQEIQEQDQKRIEAVIESQEKERKRIAEELHDSVGQMLALIKLNFSQLNESKTLLPTDEAGLFDQTLQLLDESCREVRTISHDLMPPDLQEKSLTEIVETLIRKNSHSNGISFEFLPFGITEALSAAVKFTLYRVIQEILHNTLKHADASKIIINLTQTEEEINLMVEDDGKGFDKNLTSLGLGLKNIHSRVKLLKGYFDVDSSLNRGTIYNITIPLNT